MSSFLPGITTNNEPAPAVPPFLRNTLSSEDTSILGQLQKKQQTRTLSGLQSKEDEILQEEERLKFGLSAGLNYGESVFATKEKQLEDRKEIGKKQIGFYDQFDPKDLQTEEDLQNFDQLAKDPVFSVALWNFSPEIARLGDVNIHSATFGGSSIYGKVSDPEIGVPQVTELLGRNSQTNVYMALRARGGIKGELWQTTIEKSPYLKEMLTESEILQNELQGWIDASPYFFDPKGFMPGSAYLGRTVIDILTDDKYNVEGWDAEKALEELQQSNPEFYTFLFDRIGVNIENLIKESTNPVRFKFFIADSIDEAALSRIIVDNAEKVGGFQNFLETMAVPLVRDSFNSNDMVGELAINAGLGILAATGVFTAPALVILTYRIGNRIAEGAEKAQQLAEMYVKAQEYAAKMKKMSSVLYKGTRFLPSNWADSLVASGEWIFQGRNRVPLDEVIEKYEKGWAARGLTGFRGFARRTVEIGVTEGIQGGIESAVLQTRAMLAGEQEEFSFRRLGENVAEEAIGGSILGTGIRTASKGIKYVAFNDKVQSYLNTQFKKSMDLMPKLDTIISATRQRELNLFMRAVTGSESLSDLSPAEQLKFYKDSIIMNENLNYLESVNYRGLNPGSDTGITSVVIDSLDNSTDPETRFDRRNSIRMQLLLTIGSVARENNLNGEEFETLLLSLPGLKDETRNRVIRSMWEAQNTEVDSSGNETLTKKFEDATEEELQDLSDSITEREQSVATKLGLENVAQLKDVLRVISPHDANLIRSVLREELGDVGSVVVNDLGPIDVEFNTNEEEEISVEEGPATEDDAAIVRTMEEQAYARNKAAKEQAQAEARARAAAKAEEDNAVVRQMEEQAKAREEALADKAATITPEEKTTPVTEVPKKPSKTTDPSKTKDKEQVLNEFAAAGFDLKNPSVVVQIYTLKDGQTRAVIFNPIELVWMNGEYRMEVSTRSTTGDKGTVTTTNLKTAQEFTKDPEITESDGTKITTFILNGAKGVDVSGVLFKGMENNTDLKYLLDVIMAKNVRTESELKTAAEDVAMENALKAVEAGNLDAQTRLSESDIDELNNRGCDRPSP